MILFPLSVQTEVHWIKSFLFMGYFFLSFIQTEVKVNSVNFACYISLYIVLMKKSDIKVKAVTLLHLFCFQVLFVSICILERRSLGAANIIFLALWQPKNQISRNRPRCL